MVGASIETTLQIVAGVNAPVDALHLGAARVRARCASHRAVCAVLRPTVGMRWDAQKRKRAGHR